MKTQKTLLGISVLILVFGIAMVGCSSLFKPKAPSSFSTSASGGETTILLRQGLSFDQAFREAIFVLSRNGFEPEMLQQDAGYIRTRWNERVTWFSDGGKGSYRVRILINFNPSRTQMIVKAPAEYSTGDGDNWIVGYDTRAIETLRTDLTQSIGN